MWMDVDSALSEVPVNISALIDDTDFKTREEAVTYDQAGMDLVWNFVTTAGAYTQTAVTPTTGGDYDWSNQGNGMYSIEIPASGGASINNDTEGFGWFTGYATGILPWTGPVIGFRDSDLNDKLIDSAWSATRGLAGTAVPDAAADAAGGLPISDAGGLDLDTILDVAVSTRLAPTTASRTLDVTATGAAGIDWGNVENQDTAVDLSATVIDLCDEVTESGLKDDAITAAKYDQSTAFPSTSSDGSELTEAGGDGDHLTAIDLPDQTMNITGNITGNLSGSVGSVTAGVSLADDAITSAKYDESTAFPVKSADTGVTEIARTGADGDTLEDISDEIAGLNNISADDVWDATGTETSLSFETLLERAYQFFVNELAIVDATGGATLRNFGDTGDMATWTITDDDTVTDRTAISWA